MLRKMLCLVLVCVFASGCGIKAKSYIMDKPRVDIEKGTGNAGYLNGNALYIEPVKKTRRVYLFEFTKPVSEKDIRRIEQETSTIKSVDTTIHVTTPAASASADNSESKKIVIPAIPDEEEAESDTVSATELKGPSEATTYTVIKDDTLQKISKKVYGSYSGWMKIYNANKEKIKNPNFVKPGTVLTIPAVK